MSFTTLYKIALVIVLLVVIFELGRALYFMMTDRNGDSGRAVWALTRRVAFAILLIVLIVVGIATGILHPHGVVVR